MMPTTEQVAAAQATAASMGWKRAKGKKAGATLGPDLSYIYGYINEADENDAEGSGNTILVCLTCCFEPFAR